MMFQTLAAHPLPAVGPKKACQTPKSGVYTEWGILDTLGEGQDRGMGRGRWGQGRELMGDRRFPGLNCDGRPPVRSNERQVS